MFDQLVVGAAPGDAITMCALGVKAALDDLMPTRVYSQHAEGDMRKRFEPAAELGLRPNRHRPLIFHASNGSDELFQELMQVEDEVILWYHNIAPADLMAPFAPEVASDLIRGRWELEQLRERTVLAIADSEFNASELIELGYRDVRVVPPVPDIRRLSAARPDHRIVRRLSRWAIPNGRPELVLVVGQQMPHKRIERALAAAAVLQQEYLPQAVLAVTGVWRIERYSAALRGFAEQCGLERVEWLGRVTDGELASLFDRADVLLVPSEHEGFCVPAVEAMAAGVPVVAARRAALPETIGDAGILLDEPDDPMEVAAVLNEVITNETLRAELIRRGFERAKRFDPDVAVAAFMEIVERDLRARA
jgi:L-malate glycosyltransferase